MGALLDPDLQALVVLVAVPLAAVVVLAVVALAIARLRSLRRWGV